MCKLSVFTKYPGGKPRHVNISPSMENLQKIVGGPVNGNTVTLHKGTIPVQVVILCNEEGQRSGTDPNCVIRHFRYCGPLIFIGEWNGEFRDVPLKFEDFKLSLPHLFREDTGYGLEGD